MNSKHVLIKNLIISIVIFIITFVLVLFTPFSALNNMLCDLLYQRATTVDNNIKIVKLDEKTIAEYGPVTEWRRDIPARLVETLNADTNYAPDLIVFDVTYVGDKDTELDMRFANAAKNAGNVICAANVVYTTSIERAASGVTYVNTRTIDRIEKPFDALLDSALDYGFANTLQDTDGYIRTTQLMVENDREVINSLAMSTYRHYKELHGEEVIIPPLDSLSSTGFTFSGKIGDYEAISLCDVLEGRVDSRIFTNSVVFVGSYAPGHMDSYNVAIQKGAQMYGVEIHANIFEALLEGHFSQPVNKLIISIILSILAVLFYLIIININVWLSVIVMILFILGEIIAGIVLRNNGHTIDLVYLPIVLILITVYHIISNYVIEKLNRMKTLNAFKKYVAPQIVEELSKKDNLDIKVGGARRDIAVLFVDIRGFTTMSESLEPEQVVEILNDYLSLTTKAIFNNKGTLDKFVGDCTMAVFNAPFDLDDYIYLAVHAAWDIAAGVDEISAKMMERFGRTVGFGVGVNCGPAVVGNIGCDIRMDYTAIGDTVNTAARLEANAKSGQVLISEQVYLAIKDRIEVTQIGEIPLKGKNKGVMVYQVDKML